MRLIITALGVAGLVGYVAGLPASCSVSTNVAQKFTGIATFNNYASQGSTVCGPKSASVSGYYGAAAGDLSPNISGGKCSGSINMGLCANGQSPASSYVGPSCPKTNCGTCYKVTYIGDYGTSASSPPSGASSVTVQIIDSCPSTNAWNFCKTDVPANERCGTSSTNSLDIDMSAYKALTGQDWNNSPNLDILIEPVSC